MSLLNKKSSAEHREQLTTEADVLAKQREKTRAYQKEQRERHLADWKLQKAELDSMDSNQLIEYIELSSDKASDPRVGLHSMKINPYEAAIIKAALEVTGARSSRELFVKHCKEVINNSK